MTNCCDEFGTGRQGKECPAHTGTVLPHQARHTNQVARIKSNTAANRCVEAMRAMYNFALEQKRGLYNGKNPAAEQTAHQENERSRFIQSDELGKFFNALSEVSSQTARDAILTSLLTAARKDNVISMKWEDVNLQRKEWALPGEFQKNGAPYVVPLVSELVARLDIRQTTLDLSQS